MIQYKMIEDIKILDEEEIKKGLIDLPGWEYKDNKIFKQFEFEDFMDSLVFIVRLAPFFEKNDHHPDIHIFYSKILFELQRFDIGGKVTNIDILTAKEIERVYSKR
jgi:4a-hydroxytetrahydrobiopterin dehydratase